MLRFFILHCVPVFSPFLHTLTKRLTQRATHYSAEGKCYFHHALLSSSLYAPFFFIFYHLRIYVWCYCKRGKSVTVQYNIFIRILLRILKVLELVLLCFWIYGTVSTTVLGWNEIGTWVEKSLPSFGGRRTWQLVAILGSALTKVQYSTLLVNLFAHRVFQVENVLQ